MGERVVDKEPGREGSAASLGLLPSVRELTSSFRVEGHAKE
jgi:hypothetical protein